MSMVGRIISGQLFYRLRRAYANKVAHELLQYREYTYGYYWARSELETWFPLDKYEREDVERKD